MGKEFKNVWVSGEERMQLASNHAAPGFIFIFEDRGKLETNPPFLDFHGKKQTWHLSNVKQISYFHQKPPQLWQRIITVLLILISVLALLNAIMIVRFLTTSVIELPTGLNIMSWITAFASLVVVTLVWLVHLSPYGPLGTSYWVKVVYLNHTNEVQTIYFADASKLGWGGKLGGTHKIFATLQQELATV